MRVRSTYRRVLPLVIAPVLISGCGGRPAGSPSPTSFAAENAFIDVSSALGDAGHSDGWGGLAAFDYDNDGDIDLLITSGAGVPNHLFQNDGHAHFVDVAEQAGVALAADDCVACAVGDFNNDGWLDLLIARQRANQPDTVVV